MTARGRRLAARRPGRNWKLLLLAPAASLATAVGCGYAAPDEVLIGVAVHPAGVNGATLAMEDLRASGVRVRLRTVSREDAGFIGAGAVALAEAFSRAGVTAVVGHSSSAATLSAAHIFNQQGIPLVIPNSTSPLLSGVGPWVFRVCGHDGRQGDVLAAHAWNAGRRRAAILYVLDDYGKGLAAAFASSFSARGGSLALAVGYSSLQDRPEEDLGPALGAIRRAAPDVVLLAARARDLTQLRGGGRLKEPGWPLKLGGDSFFGPLDAAQDPGLFEGAVFTRHAPPASAAARRFVERYRARFGTEAENPSFVCYDAVAVIGAAVRAAGRTDRAGIRRYLARLGRDLPPFEGVAGPLRFDDSGDAVDATFSLARVQGGQVHALEP